MELVNVVNRPSMYFKKPGLDVFEGFVLGYTMAQRYSRFSDHLDQFEEWLSKKLGTRLDPQIKERSFDHARKQYPGKDNDFQAFLLWCDWYKEFFGLLDQPN